MSSSSEKKRQFRLDMRPDEVLTEAHSTDGVSNLHEVQPVLAQLVDWGKLESQPDTAQVAS